MRQYSEDEFLYIRGYLIMDNSSSQIENVHPYWHKQMFGLNDEYMIYFDPKNELEYCKTNDKFILMLGTAMNTETGCMDKSILVNELMGCLECGIDSFFEYINILGGRHIIVFTYNGEPLIITDATGMRSTYYYVNDKKCIISSHYNLIHDIVKTDEHPFWRTYSEYQKKKYICVSLPGDMTPWNDIRMLIPNHFLSLKTNKIERFFPKHKLQDVSLQQACDYIANNIKTQYEELAKHYDLLHSMTAGCDSRICLSAAKSVKDKVTLFTYHNENPDMNDIEHRDRELNYQFAKNLAQHEGIKHVEVLFKGPYPEDLMRIMDKNHYHRINRLVEQLSKSYSFKSNTLHIRSSVVEMCRNTDHFMPNLYRPRCEKFARWAQYNDEIFNLAIPYFLDWMQRNQVDEFVNLGYSDAHIHYWENRLPTWMNASMVVEDDILCDTWMLFNVRKILSFGLCMQEYWRQKNIIFREIIMRLWPSLLQYNLPNNRKISYDLVDKEFTGCFSFNKVETNSGSLYDKNRKVEAYYEIRDYGAWFGFSNSLVRRGDFCELNFVFSVEKDTPYYYEFNIFTVWQDYVPDNIVNYVIMIDNKPIYLESCNNFNSRVNQIIYCFRALETKQQRITIRLHVVKDSNTNNYNGIINVKSITLRKEWVKKFSDEPFISSTREIYKKLN